MGFKRVKFAKSGESVLCEFVRKVFPDLPIEESYRLAVVENGFVEDRGRGAWSRSSIILFRYAGFLNFFPSPSLCLPADELSTTVTVVNIVGGLRQDQGASRSSKSHEQEDQLGCMARDSHV